MNNLKSVILGIVAIIGVVGGVFYVYLNSDSRITPVSVEDVMQDNNEKAEDTHDSLRVSNTESETPMTEGEAISFTVEEGFFVVRSKGAGRVILSEHDDLLDMRQIPGPINSYTMILDSEDSDGVQTWKLATAGCPRALQAYTDRLSLGPLQFSDEYGEELPVVDGVQIGCTKVSPNNITWKKYETEWFSIDVPEFWPAEEFIFGQTFVGYSGVDGQSDFSVYDGSEHGYHDYNNFSAINSKDIAKDVLGDNVSCLDENSNFESTLVKDACSVQAEDGNIVYFILRANEDNQYNIGDLAIIGFNVNNINAEIYQIILKSFKFLSQD